MSRPTTTKSRNTAARAAILTHLIEMGGEADRLDLIATHGARIDTTMARLMERGWVRRVRAGRYAITDAGRAASRDRASSREATPLFGALGLPTRITIQPGDAGRFVFGQNRPIDTAWARRVYGQIIEQPQASGSLELLRLPGDRLRVLDGQHRVWAALHLSPAPMTFNAVIHDEGSAPPSAIALNAGRSMSGLDRLHVLQDQSPWPAWAAQIAPDLSITYRSGRQALSWMTVLGACRSIRQARPMVSRQYREHLRQWLGDGVTEADARVTLGALEWWCRWAATPEGVAVGAMTTGLPETAALVYSHNLDLAPAFDPARCIQSAMWARVRTAALARERDHLVPLLLRCLNHRLTHTLTVNGSDGRE